MNYYCMIATLMYNPCREWSWEMLSTDRTLNSIPIYLMYRVIEQNKVHIQNCQLIKIEMRCDTGL